jgi:steroid delta-isomerase-like uncharacterized protein
MTKQNKQVVRQYFEASERQGIEGMEQFVSSANYTLHFPGMPSPTMDWNGHKQLFNVLASAFPDFRHNIEDMVAEEGEDKVTVRFNITATHKGEFQGIPPTGKKVSMSAMEFMTIIDGKITEEWVSLDMMGLMQQIGAISSSPSSGTTSSGTHS